jgi:hypothetical protein
MRERERENNRTLWVHPMISSRLEEGCFYILRHKLREDERNSFNYFRMTISSFDELHNSLRFPFHQRDTNMRCIPAVERIAVTLLVAEFTWARLKGSIRLYDPPVARSSWLQAGIAGWPITWAGSECERRQLRQCSSSACSSREPVHESSCERARSQSRNVLGPKHHAMRTHRREEV